MSPDFHFNTGKTKKQVRPICAYALVFSLAYAVLRTFMRMLVFVLRRFLVPVFFPTCVFACACDCTNALADTCTCAVDYTNACTHACTYSFTYAYT